MDLGKIAYDAYSQSVGGVSKFTGEKLPDFADQDDAIKAGWEAAASAARRETIRVGVKMGDPSALALQQHTTLRAQLAAAEIASEMVRKESDARAKESAAYERVTAEQAEVAKMQREDLAGVTWRLAVSLAQQANHRPDGTGSPTYDPDACDANLEVAARIEQDAQWFAHLLANPPVVF